ncbi:uncharacterized protein VNE69_12016 [Vairimorpha necatrix]|uniref:Uncharacterized protein n=1 Tax=Vairimorpha necatrix TaxID=6039 RepID=A0AAX4JGW8_9MICR
MNITSFNNVNEDIFLKDIFGDSLSIYIYEDTKTYQILFNNKYYEFIIDRDYPLSRPQSSVSLPDDIFGKYKTNMIYPLLFECIKKEELNLGAHVEMTSFIEYENIEKITQEEFLEYQNRHKKIQAKKEGKSGKEYFL